MDYSLSSALRVILAQRPALGDADDRREREAARAHLEITPNDPGSTFVKDVKACLDTFDRPDGDPEGIMPTIYDPDKTILVVQSTSKDTSWTYHSRSIPDHARVSLLWQPDPDLPALNGTQCEILYHELYHVYDGFQHTMDSSECGGTGIPIAEVKASFATDAYLRAQFGPSWYLDDEGNRVERPHLQEYGGKRLPSSIDECYDSSEEYRDGRGGASNDGREVSGDGGAEGAGGVGGAPGSR